MNTCRTAHARLKAALRVLVLDHPFFGHLAVSLTLKRETLGRTPTLATDGRHLFYDEGFVNSYPDEDLVTAFAHEVLHPALLHHTRRGDRDPRVWNAAGDYAINWLLQEAGFQIPSGWLIDSRFRGMTSEQIFDDLKRNAEGPGEEDPANQFAGGSASDSEAGSSNPDDGPASDPDQVVPSCANVPGEVWDSPEPAQQEAEWQVRLKQACSVATLMGSLPAGIVCAVERATEPRMDWKSILRRFVQQFVSADYSWHRPNRRYVPKGLYLPELRADSMPALVVVADTSASTQSVIDVFASELRSIQEECQPEEVIVIMADASVHRVDRFGIGEPVEFNFVGMGGTDFRPAFEYVETEQLEPACLIYLTDGEGDFPEQPSDYPTLWAITTPDLRAPWGETVTIDPSMTR